MGLTYFRFYYDLNNPNQLLPYNPNYQPTDKQGYVDYIGYPVNQERPKTLLDSKISSVIENEGEQYKPFATLSMSSSSYLEKQQASKELAPVFDEAKKALRFTRLCEALYMEPKYIYDFLDIIIK